MPQKTLITGASGGFAKLTAATLLKCGHTVIAVAGKERVGLRISPVNPYNDMRDSNPEQLFTHYAMELAKRQIVFLHVLEAVPGHFLHAAGQAPVLPALRKAFPGILIANGGYQPESAIALLAEKGADAIAFGIPFLANPDLPERFRTGRHLARHRTERKNKRGFYRDNRRIPR